MREKWSGLDVQGIRYKGRYTYEILSRYRFLKHEIESCTERGIPLTPMLRMQLPTYKSLEASLRRQRLIK